ncbi:MAG: AIPR family protein [Clostridia bacterium]|nr:AIPR family protein [Clostridia bacterium]
MDILEFRESYINEDINAEAVNTMRYPVEVFIDNAADILKNDYSLITDMSQCFFSFSKGTRAYKNMHIDAAYLDLASNALDLLCADYNEGEITNITNEILGNKSQLLLNFFENSLKGFFASAEQADPAVQLARDIRNNYKDIHTIHLFVVSTNRLSKSVKNLDFPDYTFKEHTFKVTLDVLDIEGIYRSKLAGFEKEKIVINCNEFGIRGIPCIKADIGTDQYESYLAIVPGSFLSEIYKKYSSALLESNVRSFLKFNGAVNKGIRGTILNEKSRFFTYNNGISTTARGVTVVSDPICGNMITAFDDLQIINGGQTTATLAATNIKNNADLEGIFVQMKLTVLKDSDPELIRNIAKYANSQNKVKTADLNSSHPFYVRMEDFSRKIYAPLASGSLVQQLWFFERTRGQYEQPIMQMTKAQANNYKLTRPKSMRFTLTDLAKYINAANMLPHYVSWGGEVNAAHFHNDMEKQWNKSNEVFNELFYKELIGKKILFSKIETMISSQQWYQEKRAYRPQIVAYTFSKLVLSAKAIHKEINYRQIWDLQRVPIEFDEDIAQIGKIVFDRINDPYRSTANVETYCKKTECWDIISKVPYSISDELREILISPSEKTVEKIAAKKDQAFDNGIMNEIEIFNKGAEYWSSLVERGQAQYVLNNADVFALTDAIKYCNLQYTQLTKKQIKTIMDVVKKLKENGIE